MRWLVATLGMLLMLLAGCARQAEPLREDPLAKLFAEGRPEQGPALAGSGWLSTGGYELGAGIAEDGRSLYLTRSLGKTTDSLALLRSDYADSTWSEPEPLDLFGDGSEAADGSVSGDGRWLYFAARRAADGRRQGDFDLWRAPRLEQGGWGRPSWLGPVNSREHEVHPMIDAEGVLWFSSQRSGGEGGWDVWYALPDGAGSFLPPENLGPPVNSFGTEVDVSLSPDGELLVFAGHDRPASYGSGDIWISQRQGISWSTPVNAGPLVNSAAMECCPSFSPDGALLFFSSARSQRGAEPLDRPGNGKGDLYAVAVELLLATRP